MEEVVCACIKCRTTLGRFKNAWILIGKDYYSPVQSSVTKSNAFEGTGDVYQPSAGTHLENSFLQDLACKHCERVVAFRCDRAPEGHILKKNQLLLNFKEMSVKSARTGRVAEPSVQERIALYNPLTIKISTPRRASTVQPRSQTPSLLSGRRVINGSMLPPPTPDKSHRDLENFNMWAEEAISKQKSDIARIDGAVNRIEMGLKSFQQLMEEIRAELATSRQDNASQDDLTSIREDINGFRDELASYQQAQQPRQQDLSVIRERLNQLRRDVDSRFTPDDDFKHKFGVMIKDIQIVDGRTRGVELLKEDMKRLKCRLQALENRTQTVSLPKVEEIRARESSAATFDLIQMPFDDQATLEVEEQSTFVDPKQLLLERDVENLAPKSAPKRKKSLTSKNTTKFKVRTSHVPTREDSDIFPPAESVAEEDMSRSKRKQKHTESSDELADPEPPVKKARRSAVKPSNVTIGASTIQHSYAIISDRGASPILGCISENGKAHTTNNNQREVEANPTPKPLLVKATVSEIQHQGEGQPTASPAKHKDSGRSKIHPNIASLSKPNPASTRRGLPPLKTLAAKMHPHPIQPKTIVTPEEYMTQEQTIANSSTDAVITSSERDTFQIVIPRMQIPHLEGSSPTADISKAYKCGVCKKRYKKLGGFEKHKLSSACADTTYDEFPEKEIDEEKRRRKIAEREELVKMTLERL